MESKNASRICAEKRHKGYVYFALEQQRDLHFDNATAWLTQLERFKAKLP